MRTRRWRWVVLSAVIGSAAWYLRDPAWLIDIDSGFADWEYNRSGQRLRWMGARASFFVPSGAKAIAVPLHALFLTDDRSPFVVTVLVNDRPATMVTLADEVWQTARVRIVPPAGWSRRVVRVDLRANRTWSERSISVQVGEITVVP